MKQVSFVLIFIAVFCFVGNAQSYDWGKVSGEQIEDVFLRKDKSGVLEYETASLVINASDPVTSSQEILTLQNSGESVFSASADGNLKIKGDLSVGGEVSGSRQYLIFSHQEEVSTGWMEMVGGIPCSSTKGYVIGRSGSITGIFSSAMVNDVDWGIYVRVYKNNVDTGLKNYFGSSGNSKDYDTQTKGEDIFAAGDIIHVQVTANQSFETLEDLITIVEITTD